MRSSVAAAEVRIAERDYVRFAQSAGHQGHTRRQAVEAAAAPQNRRQRCRGKHNRRLNAAARVQVGAAVQQGARHASLRLPAVGKHRAWAGCDPTSASSSYAPVPRPPPTHTSHVRPAPIAAASSGRRVLPWLVVHLGAQRHSMPARMTATPPMPSTSHLTTFQVPERTRQAEQDDVAGAIRRGAAVRQSAWRGAAHDLLQANKAVGGSLRRRFQPGIGEMGWPPALPAACSRVTRQRRARKPPRPFCRPH